MYLKLKQGRKVKGRNHPEGACIEVGDHLGGQMLLNSIAVQTSRESVLEYSKQLKEQDKVAESKHIDDQAKCTAYLTELSELKDKELNKWGKEIEDFESLSSDEKINTLMEIFKNGL